MVSNPYPDEGFATEHERWAEQEAAFCDLMVETLADSAKAYAEKALQSLSSVYAVHKAGARYPLADAYQTIIMIDTWQQMARHLRQSRICRIESDRDPGS